MILMAHMDLDAGTHSCVIFPQQCSASKILTWIWQAGPRLRNNDAGMKIRRPKIGREGHEARSGRINRKKVKNVKA